jgi:hypothetical protein
MWESARISLLEDFDVLHDVQKGQPLRIASVKKSAATE